MTSSPSNVSVASFTESSYPFFDRYFYEARAVQALRKEGPFSNLEKNGVYISEKYLPGYSANRKLEDWRFWDDRWTDNSYYYKPLLSSSWPYEKERGTIVSENWPHAARWHQPVRYPTYVR